MTLVVGRLIDGCINLHADTRIVDPTKARNEPLAGILKLLLLRPDVCIGTAGRVDAAQETYQILRQNPQRPVGDVVQLLQEQQEKYDNDVDFLVATTQPPLLVKVASGAIVSDSETYWIGDADGFDAYQAQYHSEEIAHGDRDPLGRMSLAFMTLVQSCLVPSVGDFYITVTNGPGHFVYRPYVNYFYSRPETAVIASTEPQPIPLGTTAGGSHGVSCLASPSPSQPAVALWLHHGSFGVLLCPDFSDQMILFKAPSIGAFLDAVYKAHGIRLQGLVPSHSSGFEMAATRSQS